jgi:hypothetical protein
MRSASKIAAVVLAWAIWVLAGLVIATESLAPSAITTTAAEYCEP